MSLLFKAIYLVQIVQLKLAFLRRMALAKFLLALAVHPLSLLTNSIELTPMLRRFELEVLGYWPKTYVEAEFA